MAVDRSDCADILEPEPVATSENGEKNRANAKPFVRSMEGPLFRRVRASIGFHLLCERSCAQTTYQCIRQAPSASCLKPARKLTLCVIGVPSAVVESS